MKANSASIYLNSSDKGTRVDAEDALIGLEGDALFKVSDFWRWAFSDFCDDDLKGWYAEWLVSILLGIKTERRRAWANTDLVSPSGDGIEVKSSSYWQSWKFWNEDGTAKPVHIPSEEEARKIKFAGLKVGDAIAPSPANTGYKSDLYVFAFQAQRDPATWNALDLSQWEFYMLTKEELASIATKSVSLLTLRKRCGTPMTAMEFRDKGRAKLQSLAALKKAAAATS